MRKSLHVVLITLACFGIEASAQEDDGDSAHPSYVGSERCIACHEAQSAAWSGSHHDLAWTEPGEGAILGDFNDAVIEHNGVTSRFFKRDDAPYIETEGPEGRTTEYKVQGAVGISPLQQYLLETEPKRLQVPDLAWDVSQRRWYHLYSDQTPPPGDGLHWTGPYKTWNARCAECHATGYEKNYLPETRRYESRQAELGVGCEACHGPGEAHVGWAGGQGTVGGARWPDLTDTGLTIEFSSSAPKNEIQQCAGCHSRRGSFIDGNPLPGTPFHDAYRLSLLQQGLYYADGSIRDEVYVYGSFLQSKMNAQGVRCSDCHEPHRAELKARDNAVCTQCHSRSGNPRFPTLRQAAYDDPAHHFHERRTEGALCKNCHMLERIYMGIDARRDHSFRVPRPDLAAETGAPNACTDCHQDRNAAWAAVEIEQRFPDSLRRGPHFSSVFAAAWRDPSSVQEPLFNIAEDTDLPAIVRASAIELLTPQPSEAIAARTASLLQDEAPLIRSAAVAAQRGAPLGSRLRTLTPLLEDPVKAVRIATAREMLDVQIGYLSPRSVAARKKATEEWLTSARAMADFPETHLAMGGAALVMRKPQQAESAFREAVQLDPQLVDAWVMIIRILAAVGDRPEALKASDDALAANPKNEILLMLKKQLDASGQQ